MGNVHLSRLFVFTVQTFHVKDVAESHSLS